MFIFYDLVFLIIAVIYLPVYLFKGKIHSGFLSRLGILPKGLALNQTIWVHAVSVGEALAVKGLIAGLRKAYPDKKFVITTVTQTGNKIVKSFAEAGDLVTYLPFDFSFTVSKFLKAVKPSIVVIAETELWPNLILSLARKKIPVVIVNGRISDKSLRGYCLMSFLLKPVFNKVNLFCVQSPQDKDRLLRMGVSGEKVRVTGNMKFDILSIPKDDLLPERIKLTANDKFLVAGSTHPGEEIIILNAYKDLLNKFPGLKLLIAPRHPERAGEIEKIVSGCGFIPLKVSSLTKGANVEARQVYILDTIGELLSFYRIADIVFVGGSLIKKGGHNIIEPANFSKPIITGKYLFNFRDIADLFIVNNACIRVEDSKGLEMAISSLLENPSGMAELGQKAKALIAQNQGATVKNIEYIGGLIC